MSVGNEWAPVPVRDRLPVWARNMLLGGAALGLTALAVTEAPSLSTRPACAFNFDAKKLPPVDPADVADTIARIPGIGEDSCLDAVTRIAANQVDIGKEKILLPASVYQIP